MKKLMLMLLTLGVTTMLQAETMNVLLDLAYDDTENVVWIAGSGEESISNATAYYNDESLTDEEKLDKIARIFPGDFSVEGGYLVDDEDYDPDGLKYTDCGENYKDIFSRENLTEEQDINGSYFVYITVEPNVEDYQYSLPYATLRVKCTINGTEYDYQAISSHLNGDQPTTVRYDLPKPIVAEDELIIAAEFGGYDKTNTEIVQVTNIAFYGVTSIYSLTPKLDDQAPIIYGRGTQYEDGEAVQYNAFNYQTIFSSAMIGEDWQETVGDAKVIGITFQFTEPYLSLANVATLYVRDSEDQTEANVAEFGRYIEWSAWNSNKCVFEGPTETIYFEPRTNSPFFGEDGFEIQAAFDNADYYAQMAQVISINLYDEIPLDPEQIEDSEVFNAQLVLFADDWSTQVNDGKDGSSVEIDGYGTFTINYTFEKAINKYVNVFCIDIVNLYLFYPGAHATLDGIYINGESFYFDSHKVLYGDLEGNGNYRIEIYNQYGGTTVNEAWSELYSPIVPTEFLPEEGDVLKVVFTVDGGGLPKSNNQSSSEGLEDIKADEGAEVMGIYNLAGQKILNEQRGINIIKYSDGSSEKRVVK